VRVSASETGSRFSFQPALDFIRPFVHLADDEAIMKAVTTEANERPSPAEDAWNRGFDPSRKTNTGLKRFEFIEE
jgi:hypothetical protein